MDRRGFTIIELVIVIVIMGLLLVLSFANFDNSQVNSRDTERTIDIETLALQLDAYYIAGTDGVTAMGKYPSTVDLIGHETTILRDLDTKSITAPGETRTSSLTAATNNSQTIAGVLPQPVNNSYVSNYEYIYQPIATDGTLCTDSTTQECRKFNLYYKTEADSVVHLVTSKNQ